MELESKGWHEAIGSCLFEERRTIFRLLNAKVGVPQIAEQLGRHRSTIYREIGRNEFREIKLYRGYYPVTAHDSARRRRQRQRKLIRDAGLRGHVLARLALGWSPEQIAGRLRYADDQRLCHETIYQFVYGPEGRALELHRHLLRARRRRCRRFGRKPRSLRIPLERTIACRPALIGRRDGSVENANSRLRRDLLNCALIHLLYDRRELVIGSDRCHWNRMMGVLAVMHLLGLVLGMGAAFIVDLLCLRGTRKPLTSADIELITFLSAVIVGGLALLLVSGGGFLSLYLSENPEKLTNPKLWAKVNIVFVLTLNGFLVHDVALPHLKNQLGKRIFEDVDARLRLTLVTIGAVSAVSWVAAFALGAVPALNNAASFAVFVATYLVVATIAVVVSYYLTAPKRLRQSSPISAAPA